MVQGNTPSTSPPIALHGSSVRLRDVTQRLGGSGGARHATKGVGARCKRLILRRSADALLDGRRDLRTLSQLLLRHVPWVYT
jgi:hypothetical protein